MMRFTFWRIWLSVASVCMIVLGLLMVFFNQHPLFVSINEPIHIVFWPNLDMTDAVGNFQRWVYGTWGAAIAAMGIFATFLTQKGFSRKEKWARDCLGASILVWYLLDTMVSLSCGVVANAVFNTVCLIGFALPLIFTRRDFGNQHADSFRANGLV